MVWAGLPSMSLDRRSPPRSIEISLLRISLLYLTGSSLGLHPRRCCPQSVRIPSQWWNHWCARLHYLVKRLPYLAWKQGWTGSCSHSTCPMSYLFQPFLFPSFSLFHYDVGGLWQHQQQLVCWIFWNYRFRHNLGGSFLKLQNISHALSRVQL